MIYILRDFPRAPTNERLCHIEDNDGISKVNLFVFTENERFDKTSGKFLGPVLF